MKFFVVISLVLTVIVAASFAANCKIGNQDVSPDQIVPHSDAPCTMLKCLDDGSTQYIGCPIPSLAAGCRDEGSKNPSAPYPECCDRIIKCE